ncbi:type II toxin-antitoxin system RatA family toxin [Candidatus Rariloculus sp.]|uniref:type II toxin-antitoxin system RatA family toxin n=1 Tax=Candidatus Rariloculus sp. TaxID=3101265 RepID=UPI003D1437DF
MPSVRRSERSACSAAQMFALVNDIEAYPQFLKWCHDARIENRNGNTVEAVMYVGMSGFNRSFRTRNTLDEPHRIDIELVSGPFRRLEGGWRFRDLPDGGAEVALSLEIEVAGSLFGALFASVAEELAHSQLSAFIERAKHRYG